MGVLISEVGPRDGLQGSPRLTATEDKKTWIDLEAMSLVREFMQTALEAEQLYGFSPLAGRPRGFAPATNKTTTHTNEGALA